MSMTLRTAVLFFGVLFSLGAMAQPAPDDEPGPYDQADPPSRVARLSYLHGAVSFVPAGENDWVEAQLNRPLISGDKLWTDRDSRAELEIGPAALRIDEETSFDFLNLDDDTAQVELTQGALNLRVRRLYDNQVYEIDTPTLAFVIDRVGEYRISVAPDGDTTIVSVMRGGGDAYGEDGARFRIEEGQAVTFNDSQLRDYYTDALPPPDDFDDFIAERDGRWDHARSRQYVSEDVIGYEDLDDNGEWDEVADYGHVWYPTTVAVGWTPYHYGHWGWVGAYGWTWIDDAPWGFAPFHYGRWAYIGNRWGWCPGPRSVRPYYAPALVAFIGGGVTVSIGGPVGWFPLGPRDVYFPGYHVSRGYFTRVNVSNTIVNTTIINNYYGGYSRGSINYAEVNFRNRGVAGAVIAVPGAAFVNARPVHGAAISVGRDTFRNARVSAFAPLAPTRASLVASTARPGRTPPARAFDRRIVAATKPPPPVASFAAREAVLRKDPGRPLTTRQMRSLPAEPAAAAADAQARRRANVKVVTNAGVPNRTPAAPLAAREGKRGAAARGNAENARRAAGTTPERPGRPNVQGAGDERAAPRGGAQEQHLRSSEFVRGSRRNPGDNRAPGAGENATQRQGAARGPGNPSQAEDNGNRGRGQDNAAAAREARNPRANPAAEPPGNNARANPGRPQRQPPADRGDNAPSPNPRAESGQERAAQAREQAQERAQQQQMQQRGRAQERAQQEQAQERAQAQERGQQQRAEQADMQQQRRAQQQQEQQRERAQQADAQQQRMQQQRAQQAEAQQQRMQEQRAQQAEAQQQRMQQQRAQQAEAQQQRMQQQRAQQAEAQQQRMQQQAQERAQQAQAQQQRLEQQRAQQQRMQPQPQQRNAPPPDRGSNDRRGKKKDKNDDDDGGGR